ncbi:MAG: hypothetical protein AB7N76_09540 [Planctomycetota bacterium]
MLVLVLVLVIVDVSVDVIAATSPRGLSEPSATWQGTFKGSSAAPP